MNTGLALKLALDIVPGIAVPALLHAEMIFEQVTVLVADDRVYFCRGPYVKCTLFLHGAVVVRKRVRILGAVECARLMKSAW